MAETTKTREQLVDEALANLFADGGAGQSPDPEDAARVDSKVDGLFAELAVRDVCVVDNDDEIPSEWFNPLAELLANECAPSFGGQKSKAARDDAEDRIRQMVRQSPLRMLRFDPMFSRRRC